jgi:hypothetical protein
MNPLLLIEITKLIPGPEPTASELRGRRNPGGVCRQYMEAETFFAPREDHASDTSAYQTLGFLMQQSLSLSSGALIVFEARRSRLWQARTALPPDRRDRRRFDVTAGTTSAAEVKHSIQQVGL